MDSRSLLPRRAPAGAAVAELDRHRVARLERALTDLETERDELRAELALARSWVRQLVAWIEHDAPEGDAPADGPPGEPGPVRRAATIAILVAAPWVAVGVAIGVGFALF